MSTENDTVQLFRVVIKKPCRVYAIKVRQDGVMKYTDGEAVDLVPEDVIEVERIVARALVKKGHECKGDLDDPADPDVPDTTAAAKSATESGRLLVTDAAAAQAAAEAHGGYLITPTEQLTAIYNNRPGKAHPYVWLQNHVVKRDPTIIGRTADEPLEENLKNGVYVVFGGSYHAVAPNKEALAAFYKRD